MVEAKLVSIDELLKDNTLVCLSALRVFRKCELCQRYASCDSKIINKQLLSELEERERLKKQLKEIKERLKRI